MENTSAAQQQDQPNLGIQEFTLTPSGTAIVQKVDRFGSFGKAGITSGDEILAIAGQELPVPNLPEYVKELCARMPVGSDIEVRVRRDGEERSVPVRLLAKKTLQLDIDEASEVLERKIAP